MKNFLVLMIFAAGIVFPLACSDNNPNKTSGPTISTGGGTSTPSSVQGTPGTPTPIPTFSIPAPIFQGNYRTSASPNQLVINPSGGGYILTVAELQNTTKGTATGVESFSTGGGGTLALQTYGGSVLQGFPTPNSTPPWTPVTVGLNGPQGFVNPGGGTGYAAILDAQPGGGAILYTGYSYAPATPYNGWSDYGYGLFWQPTNVSSYSGIHFNNPKGLAADTNSNIYVADTGNGYVEEFTGPALNWGVVPEGFWSGFVGVTIGGSGVTFSQASVAFKSPYAVTCDPLGNVWVSDTGYSPSMVEEFNSGATTILESWPALPNSVVHGLTVDNSANCNGGPCVYVADAGANIVEVYSTKGVLMTEMTDPNPSAHIGYPFTPSCVAYAQIGGLNYVFVGDSTNDFIDVFK